MIIKLLEKLGRKKIIYSYDGLKEYMIRFYILFKPKNDCGETSNSFNLFLHNFKASDEPICHNHPWPWFRLILAGGYWEHYTDGTKKWIGRWNFAWRKAEDYHWIELEPGLDTWSLFGHGRRKGPWGFLFPEGWIYWRDGIKRMKNKTDDK